MTNPIIIKTTGRVMTACFNRPDKKNAITQAMYATLSDALDRYVADDNLRAFVITAEGDMFTAGNDLDDFAASSAEGEPPVMRFLAAIQSCPKPLIAAVNGQAIGIGLTLLLHCDLVFAAQSATISAPFVGVGVVPEAGSSLLLPAAVGRAVANDIFLTGRRLSADEALQFGLISRIFADDQLAAESQKIAQQVAHSAPTAVKRTKALINTKGAEVAERMAQEGALFQAQLNSAEFSECVMAFREKRAPKF